MLEPKNSDMRFVILMDSLYKKALKSLKGGDFKVKKYTKSNIVYKYLQTFHYGLETDIAYYIMLIKCKESTRLGLIPKILYNSLIRTPLKYLSTFNRYDDKLTVINKRKVRIIIVSILNSL